MPNYESSELEEAALHARRRAVVGRLFMRAARVFQEIAVERIRALGYPDYSIGDNAVLVHLETGGNRITELAMRAGVTKQAISQLVRDLEKRGLVVRAPDPADGRAQLVCFTPTGRAMMEDAFEVVFALDDEFASLLPDGELDVVRAHLVTLLEKLDPQGF